MRQVSHQNTSGLKTKKLTFSPGFELRLSTSQPLTSLLKLMTLGLNEIRRGDDMELRNDYTRS